MNQILIYLLDGLAGLVLGVVIGSFILRKLNAGRLETMMHEAEEKAEVIKKEKILQAKERFLELKTEHEKAVNERNNAVQINETRLKQKETFISQKFEENQRKQNEITAIRENLNNQLEIITKKAVRI